MKTATLLFATGALLLGAAVQSHAEDPAAFTVHEWGTFTVVVGSDGRQVPWWTADSEGPSALPPFVKPVSISLAKSQTWLMRMETPVLYFYSPPSDLVTIRVDDSKLRVTEAFPGPSGLGFDNGFGIQWRVRLHPPNHETRRFVPHVGERGAHYRHAREVPDAWIVEGLNDDLRTGVEKFIFYRGAGSQYLPGRIAAVADGRVKLDRGGLPAYLVEADGLAVKWRRIEGVAAGIKERGFETPYPSRDKQAQQGAEGLAAALEGDLIDAGLTSAEARAMVTTWREAWMAEPGMRLLELLPRSYVDRVLPLEVKPQPAKSQRVFVARWEMIPEELERRVIASAADDQNQPEIPNSRFLPAIVERAAQVRDGEFRRDLAGLVSRLNQAANAGTKK